MLLTGMTGVAGNKFAAVRAVDIPGKPTDASAVSAVTHLFPAMIAVWIIRLRLIAGHFFFAKHRHHTGRYFISRPDDRFVSGRTVLIGVDDFGFPVP